MSDGTADFENVLHILLTAPPRLSDMCLADALVLIFFKFRFCVN